MLTLIALLSGFAVLIGWAWLMIAGFAESVLWGVGILLVPPLAFVFGYFNRDEYFVPFGLLCTGAAIRVVIEFF